MNLIACRLQDGAAFLPDGGRLQLPGGPRRNGDIWLGIRPESLTFLPPASAAAPAEFRGPARIVEPLGAETLVTLDVGDAELHARVPPRSVRQAGEPVRLSIDPAALHLFARDAEGFAAVSAEAAAREAICRLGHSLFARGLTFGSSGNISQRIDGGWLMTPTNVGMGDSGPGAAVEARP